MQLTYQKLKTGTERVYSWKCIINLWTSQYNFQIYVVAGRQNKNRSLNEKAGWRKMYSSFRARWIMNKQQELKSKREESIKTVNYLWNLQVILHPIQKWILLKLFTTDLGAKLWNVIRLMISYYFLIFIRIELRIMQYVSWDERLRSWVSLPRQPY